MKAMDETLDAIAQRVTEDDWQTCYEVVVRRGAVVRCERTAARVLTQQYVSDMFGAREAEASAFDLKDIKACLPEV